MTTVAHDIERAFRGEIIWGDDFSAEELAAWYADEKEAFAELYGETDAGTGYPYHMLNRIHLYSRLPRNRRFAHALGLGAAHGEEIRPLADRVDRFTILEPSLQFDGDNVAGVPARWVRPVPSGDMPFEDGTFDLLTCLGVLHHIPNVSHVLREMGRVMRPDGYMLLREPVVSMGDWRRKRPGLTTRERGVPRALFLRAVEDAGFDVVRARMCMSRVWTRGLGKAVPRFSFFNSGWATRVDALASSVSSGLCFYHTRSILLRLGPASMTIVARKRG